MITQNVTPITPLPSFLAPERPAAVDNLVEAELPLLTEELAEVINQINSTETNINNKESSVTNKYNEIQPHFDEIDLVAAAIASGDMPTIIDDTDISTSKTWSSKKINSTVDIHSKTEKTTLVNADEIMLADSTSTFSLKKITWESIKTLLASLFISKVTSTDNAITRFNGTTGLVKNSVVTISNTGNINFPTGARITGDFSNASFLSRVLFQTSTLNDATILTIIPNGSAQLSQIQAYSNSSSNNCSRANIGVNSSTGLVHIISDIVGSGTYLPMTFSTGGYERMRIDTSGNVLVTGSGALGYGTGAGGTVTQLTSKSTAVTLNKPTGQITMNSAALAAGASVLFPFYNSTCDTNVDQLIVNMHSVVSGWNNYKVENAGSIGSGGNFIRLTNISGISLSESPSIKFTVIKGAAA